MIPHSLRPGPSDASLGPESYEDVPSSLDDDRRGESSSVKNGIERVVRSPNGGQEVSVRRSRTHRHDGAHKAKTDAYTDYSNKTLPPEETDFMIKQLEKQADPRLRRTYANGHPLEEVIESAPILTVGLKFLPGADKPQVARTEQINMEGKEADQKDAHWRVATAGSLLSQFNVSPDLQITQTDQTASILARAKYQAQQREGHISEPRKEFLRRKRYSDTVTIDSERVKVVKDLRTGQWDLRGLLVEVDWKSLWDLMINYRSLIAKGGPDMTFDETRTLLETMIEDARRLCIRSPILFRMSTRVSIINSENTRYGINQGPMFQTLTTSKGIREIISLSAAYYNSLDPNGGGDATQQFIRPRFLQMIVLLVSLLNNEDLAELKDFLEATYKFNAERRDIELLILKVIPLLSINPRVFLNALVPAIDGFPLSSGNTNSDEDHGHIWNIFVKRILEYGYILPGTVDDLGRKRLSWIIRWPEDGFKSTAIFNTLQYCGRLRTINDIPPVEVHPGSDCTELTIVMTDDSKYVISPKDLDNIVYMTPGVYPLQEAGGTKRCYDLIIHETSLSGELYQAVKMTNNIVQKVNQWLASPKRSNNVVSKLVRKRPDHQPFLKEFTTTGRLVEVFALLNQSTLAVTYKIEGRKISRIDAIQNMARDIRHLRAFITHIEHRGDVTDHGFFSAEKRDLKHSLDQAKAQIGLAEQSRMKINLNEEVSNEPIAKVLYPEGVNIGDGNAWNGYKAWCQEHNGYLRVEATNSIIRNVRWLTDEVIELSLDQRDAKIFVTPLKPVPEGYRNDEARSGDLAVLLGRFVAIGEYTNDSSGPNAVFSMTNYLRIVNMEEPAQSRRGKNRADEAEGRTVCCFK